MDFKTVVKQADLLKEKLSRVKRDLGDLGFGWYPHRTLDNVIHMDHLLKGANRSLFGDQRLRILDIGCQDGEFSFLMESLGHEVTAIDYPPYNHNGMRGVRALKAALGSSIELHEIDIDRQFTLPHESYDIAAFMGVLYHLRNPFYALDEVARRAAYCLLSTRIARRLPDGSEMPKNFALAYLLDERELNDDKNNYFIFSEPALRLMLKRSHWSVCAFLTAGCRRESDPVRVDRDERVFCLLKTRYGRLAHLEVLDGWHESEGTGWRWTRQEFSARLQWGNSFPPQRLKMQLYLNEDLLNRVNPFEVSLSVNGCALAPELYQAPGAYTLVRTVSPSSDDEYLLQFRLNGALPPDDVDRRERGLVVTSIELE